MDRREYLKVAGAATTLGIGTLGGCVQVPQGEEGTETEAGQDDGEEGTESPTPTETETGTETPADEGGGNGDGGSNEVAMLTEGQDFIFDPIGLFVEPGTTVTWVNESGSHSSTAYHEENDAAEETRIPEDAEPWDSGTLSEEGATFEHTFETPGTYDYFCLPHKSLGMVARIVVGEPGGPAEGSMPPDGDVPESQTIVEQGSVSYEEFSG